MPPRGPHSPQGLRGRHPPQGLYVTVHSGPHPPQGGRARTTTGGLNCTESGHLSASDRADEAHQFTRTEIVSLRLVGRKPHAFYVLISSHTPGAILIESLEISICDEDEPVCNIPISTPSVLLEKPGDSHIFRPTDRQFDAISEYLEDGKTVAVRVHYLAAEKSELKIGVIDKHCHHKLRYILAIIGLGVAAKSIAKHLPVRSSAPAT